MNLICPECKKEGKKSRVYPGASTTTLMYCAPYYDEDGEYHHHDSNWHDTDYRCSEGHRWSERTPSKCPNPKCDWKQNV